MRKKSNCFVVYYKKGIKSVLLAFCIFLLKLKHKLKNYSVDKSIENE